MKIVYVTGITGFIGSNLLEHLLQKFTKVINFTRYKTIQIYEKKQMEEIDISNNFIAENPSNILINLATLYQPNINSAEELKSLIQANILFPAGVLEVLNAQQNLRILFIKRNF